MGLLDHRRTWHYRVAANPKACLEAFAAAFNGKGGLVTKAKWNVVIHSDGTATARYMGRKGIGAVGSVFSRTAAQEAETAVGSTVSFTTESTEKGVTRCSMALTSSGRSGIGGTLGFTSDARFMRPYMQAVSDHIQALDPAAKISTT